MGSGLLLASCGRPEAGFQGVIEYDERVISSEVAGRILSVRIHRGDLVAPRDVLATFEDSSAALQRAVRASEVAVAQAEVALTSAPARHEDVRALSAQLAAGLAKERLLRKTARRTRRLYRLGAVTQVDADRAESDLTQATNERRVLQQKLALVRKGSRPEELARAETRANSAETAVALEDDRVAKHTLRSAVAGTVLDLHVDVGEFASVGTPVATIADITRPRVDVFIPQDALDGIKVGTKVQIRVDATRSPIPGAVEWTSPRTEFTPRYLFSERERPNLVIRVRVRIDDKTARLHAGVPAFVTVL